LIEKVRLTSPALNSIGCFSRGPDGQPVLAFRIIENRDRNRLTAVAPSA